MQLNWMDHSYTAQLTPLWAPDHREKGFNFAGCAIVVTAMKRWPGIVDNYQGTWEDYLREQYLREARLQDALIVNLGTGDPLTEEEVRLADPYCLAVMYEDGTFSKEWEEPRVDRSHVMREQVLKEPVVTSIQAKERRCNIEPGPENILDRRRFVGSPCRQCGGTLRYIKSKQCIPCARASDARQLAKRRQTAEG